MATALALVAFAVRVEELPALMEVGLAARVMAGFAVEPLKTEHPVNGRAMRAGKMRNKIRGIDRGTDSCDKGSP
jgi:hypothetical protein